MASESVFVKRVDSQLYHTNMSLSLKNLQNVVGGYIEALFCGYYNGQPVLMICDEEGKLKGSELNFWWVGVANVDMIVGDVVFLKQDGEEFAGLEGDLESFRSWCHRQGLEV